MRDDLPHLRSTKDWDRLLALALLATLLPALGLYWAAPHIQRARITEAFSTIRAGQISAQEALAFGLEWPKTASHTVETQSGISLTLRNGAIDATFGPTSELAGYQLTMRAGIPLNPADPALPTASTLLWQCGQGEFPIGVAQLAESQTSLPPDLLPLSCRRPHAAEH